MDQKRSSMLMHDGRILGAFDTKQDRWKDQIIQYRLVIKEKGREMQYRIHQQQHQHHSFSRLNGR